MVVLLERIRQRNRAYEQHIDAAYLQRLADEYARFFYQYDDAPLLIVDDTLKALERLGTAARARTAAKIIAVTGSVGKTSTKDMLRTMLAGQGRVHAAVRSFNNHWGVPLTSARMPVDTDWAVIEIGTAGDRSRRRSSSSRR